jgi:para-aminobenzoate synthetase component 1
MSPLVEEIVPPLDAAALCEALAGLPYRIFLDSARPGTRFGRYSFLTADPVAVVRSRGTETECLDLLTGAVRSALGDPLAVLRGLMAPHKADPQPGLPPFQGGAAGYVAYDWGLTLERLPSPRYDDLGLPDLVMGIYDWVIAWDHDASRAWLISTGIPETSADARHARARARSALVKRRLETGGSGAGTLAAAPSHLAPGPSHLGSSHLGPSHLAPGPSHPRPPAPGPSPARSPAPSHSRTSAPSHFVDPIWWPASLEIRSSFTREGYLAAVEQVREYIFAGDIFQANLSQRFEAAATESPWSFYRRLRERNAAPFAAFLDFPDVVVVSASPERFLHVDVNGLVETRPIKGTRPRGVGPEHDAALGQALAESAKDRAENLMIVDLMRNDLSRVCRPRTVRVSELFSLERYATVHHLVSTVVGELATGADASDLLRAAFPGGSITGAPKLRAMEVIAELEPSKRGVYCGAIGYWSVTGELDTSIAIRTAIVQDGRVYFSAGGGIVADSRPEQEYLETLDKARAMIDTLDISKGPSLDR